MFVCRSCIINMGGMRPPIPLESRLLRPLQLATRGPSSARREYSTRKSLGEAHGINRRDLERGLGQVKGWLGVDVPPEMVLDQSEIKTALGEKGTRNGPYVREEGKQALRRPKKLKMQEAMRANAEWDTSEYNAPTALTTEEIEEALKQVQEVEEPQVAATPEESFRNAYPSNKELQNSGPEELPSQQMLKVKKVVKKHLQYLKDPLHIAEHVRKALGAGKWDEALMMARMAAVDTKVEVSWNHLIDYQLDKGRLLAAIKTFNEMKKRGQKPNARTYTVLFRGCAASADPKRAVAEATKIYNSMLSKHQTSGMTLEPSTIHMNAVLDVCGRANDLDSMFQILETSNNGLRSPDVITFTIVLNALRFKVKSHTYKFSEFSDAQIRRNVEDSIQKARVVWEDVVAKWRSGRLVMDEQLVLAMGQVLLPGDKKEQESIFDLLKQTMLIPVPDSIARKLRRVAQAQERRSAEQAAEQAALEQEEEEGETELVGLGDIETTPPPPTLRAGLARTGPAASMQYANPGRQTVTLIMDVLASLKQTAIAPKYWEYLTETLDIEPDHMNYNAYLRCLRVGHASGEVAKLIAVWPPKMLNRVTFRLGMNSCINDRNNTNVFENGTNIVDIMFKELHKPDLLTMRLYLHLARIAKSKFRKQDQETKYAYGEQISNTVNRLFPVLNTHARSLAWSEEPTKSPLEVIEANKEEIQEAMATARHMISAIDVVCHEHIVKPAIASQLMKKRRTLSIMVERFLEKLYPDRKLGRNNPNPDLQKDGWAHNASVNELSEDLKGNWKWE
ncbi:hypothetical protein QBC40DRAFT_287840 [Triangularia verruculosa]|uniref:Pentatricopeptide repeat protein n=1 Tax=Triangularia verruculosa TaxID=2587418 RepID=A0AAN6XCL1_9PEZI|nr:hypothetical protein QBC40DRAFT_287840 [Triangularia verruculosa]